MYLSYILLLIYTLGSCNSTWTLFEDSSLEKNISECVLDISKTYFDKHFPVLIQTPSTWYPENHPNHKYGDKLIQMLHIENHFSLGIQHFVKSERHLFMTLDPISCWFLLLFRKKIWITLYLHFS
mgnify:CR=1 FL=1